MRKGKVKFKENYDSIISLDNLFLSWRKFINGKRNRKDVQVFSLYLMDNIFSLHDDLFNYSYRHGDYQAFRVSDPKPRNIHKASVRDRLLHRAIYRVLYPFFDKTFIADSYSCRLERGTYRAVDRFREFAYRASQNDTSTCWILKGDIRKFFASIDHLVLLDILREYISDKNIMWLLNKVISSFSSGRVGVGLPLGNLTSQLFANIYLNKFDQFVKHKLKVKYYIRYADDFVIFSQNKEWLKEQIGRIKEFLRCQLKLELHPEKIFIKTLEAGVDFLGWINFPGCKVIRTATKRRLMRRILANPKRETIASYFGLLSHGNTYRIKRSILEHIEARNFDVWMVAKYVIM